MPLCRFIFIVRFIVGEEPDGSGADEGVGPTCLDVLGDGAAALGLLGVYDCNGGYVHDGVDVCAALQDVNGFGEAHEDGANQFSAA